MESGFSCELYDTSFSFKPAVNVSFDGCYIEDDFVPVTRGLAQKLQQSQWVSTNFTALHVWKILIIFPFSLQDLKLGSFLVLLAMVVILRVKPLLHLQAYRKHTPK